MPKMSIMATASVEAVTITPLLTHLRLLAIIPIITIYLNTNNANNKPQTTNIVSPNALGVCL